MQDACILEVYIWTPSYQVRVMNILKNPILYGEKWGLQGFIIFFFFVLAQKPVGTR